MHKAVSGAFVGAVVGAGVAAFQAKSSDTAAEDQMPAILKGAAEGALAGGLVGSFVQWRVNRRTRDVGLRGISRRAARRADHVRARVLDASETLLPHVEELADRSDGRHLRAGRRGPPPRRVARRRRPREGLRHRRSGDRRGPPARRDGGRGRAPPSPPALRGGLT